ncbi:unnamed protein product [Blumeria hordei]|uniref:Indoleamine 2,3-dioxygenase n=2 Tax=Blumeria hordei TaxID=2867405 RepID=A0A383USF0_BLUHO|nr:hypothetical protein BGHDH14_bgh00169 [Blumeria hordei DH14]SZF02709.1 unnamed protein product [Blumeria hordei]
MLPAIPRPEDYGVTAHRGFLPVESPLERLPDPYYNKWESIISNLQGLILSKRLRGVIEQLPVLSCDGLEHEAEWQRAYSILSIMAHSYIWGGERPAERLARSISIPLLQVSAHLDIPPVATYAAVCLWNFKVLFEDEDIDNVENLATLCTFTGSTDESWFYLVSVAIEARAGPTIPTMLKAIEAARVNDSETVTSCLQTFAEAISDIGRLLERMHERCDPHVFYHRIRPFLTGSKNAADAGLPNGVYYEDETGSGRFHQYSGGSNAQSSIIQFFDLVLGIEHFPTGESKHGPAPMTVPPRPSQNFIHDMRNYMPAPHRKFLNDVSKVANIHNYVHSNQHNDELTLAYDACLKMLSDLRTTHLKIVSRYIIIKSHEAKAAQSQKLLGLGSNSKPDSSTASSKLPDQGSSKKKLHGTGGTSLLPFLKQARDETGQSAVNAWAKRIMSRGSDWNARNASLEGKVNQKLPVERQASNPAACWNNDGIVGGLCQF